MGTTAGEHVALLIRAHLVIDDGCIKSLSWGFASYELFIESLCEKCGDIIPYFGQGVDSYDYRNTKPLKKLSYDL